jgi:hypothetical protein
MAEWRGLDSGPAPAILDPGWHVADELDIADLVSESAHAFGLSERHSGYVYMKLFPHPRDASHDLFDAGRILFSGNRAHFELSNLVPKRKMRLEVRAAPCAAMHCGVKFNGKPIGHFTLPAKDAWVESSLDVAADQVKDSAAIEITAERGECNLFHVWALQPDL